jgi:hypothetical protein
MLHTLFPGREDKESGNGEINFFEFFSGCSHHLSLVVVEKKGLYFLTGRLGCIISQTFFLCHTLLPNSSHGVFGFLCKKKIKLLGVNHII